MKAFLIIVILFAILVTFVNTTYYLLEKYANENFFFKKAKGIAERIINGKGNKDKQ